MAKAPPKKETPKTDEPFIADMEDDEEIDLMKALDTDEDEDEKKLTTAERNKKALEDLKDEVENDLTKFKQIVEVKGKLKEVNQTLETTNRKVNTMNDLDSRLKTLKTEIGESTAKVKEGNRYRWSDEHKEAIIDWIADYNEQHERGGQAAIVRALKTVSKISELSIVGWKKKASGQPAVRATRAPKAPKAFKEEDDVPPPVINKDAVMAFLLGRGFKFSESIEYKLNEEGKIEKVSKLEGDAKLTKLNFQYDEMGKNDKGVFITQTSPMIKVSCDIETFLNLVGVKA